MGLDFRNLGLGFQHLYLGFQNLDSGVQGLDILLYKSLAIATLFFPDPSHSQASLQSKLERAIANACSAERGDLENITYRYCQINFFLCRVSNYSRFYLSPKVHVEHIGLDTAQLEK